MSAFDRESIRRAVQPVLWNASNYPRPAQPHILGQDISPLTDRVVSAVLGIENDSTDAADIRKRLELELIDDAFCDVYADQPIGTRGHVALGKAIDRLQSWRRQHGMTYEPFEGGSE
jgi:hypothetical protein